MRVAAPARDCWFCGREFGGGGSGFGAISPEASSRRVREVGVGFMQGQMPR